jgi:hypothetical protein
MFAVSVASGLLGLAGALLVARRQPAVAPGTPTSTTVQQEPGTDQP